MAKKRPIPVQEKQIDHNTMIIAVEDMPKQRKHQAPPVKRIEPITKYNRRRERYAELSQSIYSGY